MKCRWWIPVLLLLGVFASADRVEGHVYNLHLVTDNVPDYTDMSSLAHSTADLWQTPQDKAIAVWRWGRRSRRQTSCATEDGRTIWDPILHYNSYGAMNCGIISSLNIASWLELGFHGRYIQLGDHTVSEVSWDEGKTWHLFDSSMSMFCYNHKGRVASCDEIQQAHACELSGRQERAGTFLLLSLHAAVRLALRPDGLAVRLRQPGREPTDALQRGRFLYAQLLRRPLLPVCPDRPPLHAGHQALRVVYPILGAAGPPASKGPDAPQRSRLLPARREGVLRAGRSPRSDGHPWQWPVGIPARPGGQELARVRLRRCGTWWRRRTAGPGSIRPRPGGPAFAVFKISAANVITSHADRGRSPPPYCGRRPENLRSPAMPASAGCRSGRAESMGPLPIRLSLRKEVAGVTQCLVKVEILGGGGEARRRTRFAEVHNNYATQPADAPQPSPGRQPGHALGRRATGDNRDLAGLAWRSVSRNGGGGRRRLERHAARRLLQATSGAGVNGKPCSVTWKLTVPSEIHDVFYAR